jgi:hypothetical protein
MIGVHPINKRETTRNGKRAAVRVSGTSMPRVTLPLVTASTTADDRNTRRFAHGEGPPSKQP